jgi:hypothetical protein
MHDSAKPKPTSSTSITVTAKSSAYESQRRHQSSLDLRALVQPLVSKAGPFTQVAAIYVKEGQLNAIGKLLIDGKSRLPRVSTRLTSTTAWLDTSLTRVTRAGRRREAEVVGTSRKGPEGFITIQADRLKALARAENLEPSSEYNPLT